MKIDLNRSFPEGADGSRGPLPKQKEFLDAALDPQGPKHIAYVGGIGCILGSSLIETAEGPKPLTSIRLKDQILSSTQFSLGSVPFPKGKDYLYRVQHERGEFVALGSHLVVSDAGEYLPVYALQEGNHLASFDNLPVTTLELSQPVSQPDARHLWRRASSFLSHCLECYHRYGQLPPEVVGIAQEIVPLLVDVLKYNLSDADRDDLQALAQGHIRHDRLCALLSNLGSFALGEALPLVLEDSTVALPSGPVSLDSPQYVQSLLTTICRQLPNESDHQTDFSLLSCTRSYTKIVKVSRTESPEWYWDIEVPQGHNYFSEGILHHNSGKTLIGCITMLCWAILHPGDYLVARQFYPELKITTLKTFLEITPKDLIVEYRAADGIVRIKSTSGVSNIIFRQLEEPDKLRSLNLSGAYIDEASQTSEAAFMLLQGRLRGKGLRKIILTTNPNGHDYLYRWFVKQDFFKTEESKKSYKLIKAPSTENKHLPEGYLQSMFETWSEDRIRREIHGDFDSFEGQVYSEFRHDVHVVQPFVIPDEWTRIAGMDHGYRNPTAFLWGAVDYDGNVFIYREFYKSEWLIEEICNGKGNEPGIVQLSKGEKLDYIKIDPSTRARRGQGGKSDFDFYMEHLPDSYPLQLANNEKTAGIDRVKSFLKVHPRTNKPKLFVFNNCHNLIDEIAQYRYVQQPSHLAGKSAEKEEPVKLNDHAVDALRYLIMGQPEPPKIEDKPLKYATLESHLAADLKSYTKPQGKDPFGSDF